MLFFVLSSGCSKSNDTTPANPFGGDKGQATIWAPHPNTADFPITVTIGGAYIGTIGAPLPSAPDCQQSNNDVVKFVAEPGTYNMLASSAGGTWTGTLTIQSGSCALFSLN